MQNFTIYVHALVVHGHGWMLHDIHYHYIQRGGGHSSTQFYRNTCTPLNKRHCKMVDVYEASCSRPVKKKLLFYNSHSWLMVKGAESREGSRAL